ncbi:unnamed protein product [Cyprideis torosa]|uniref:Uncharacterized protein n=1 Tax=Cyprideis torosa TaxID=163714 RepID=A0A7R8WH57_9CRUS|nr:unnamed protein product [Cyprideis torosa]CAG0893769.1 unnamed protein product [Cyprideis torosa]
MASPSPSYAASPAMAPSPAGAGAALTPGASAGGATALQVVPVKRPRTDLVQRAVANFMVDRNYSETGIVKRHSIKTSLSLEEYEKMMLLPIMNSKPNAISYALCLPNLLSELQQLRNEIQSQDELYLLHAIVFLGLAQKSWDRAKEFRTRCASFLPPELNELQSEADTQTHFRDNPIVLHISFWDRLRAFFAAPSSSGAVLSLLNGFVPERFSPPPTSAAAPDSPTHFEAAVCSDVPKYAGEYSSPLPTTAGYGSNSEPPPPPGKETKAQYYCVHNAFQGLCSAWLSPWSLSTGFESSVIKMFSLQGDEEEASSPLYLHGHVGPVYALRTFPLNGQQDLSSVEFLCEGSKQMSFFDATHPEEAEKRKECDPLLSSPLYREGLVSAGADHSIRLWKNGRNVAVYRGHTSPVWTLDLHGDHLMASGAMDTSVRIFDVERTYPLRSLHGHELDVDCVAFHPNGAYLASGSSDRTVRLWSVTEGRLVRLFHGHRSVVMALAFSPDGKHIATAGEDRRIRIWDLASSNCLKELRGHTDSVLSLAYSPEGDRLASCGMDATLRLWNMNDSNAVPNSEEVLATPALVNYSPLLSCRFLSDNLIAFIGSKTQEA